MLVYVMAIFAIVFACAGCSSINSPEVAKSVSDIRTVAIIYMIMCGCIVIGFIVVVLKKVLEHYSEKRQLLKDRINYLRDSHDRLYSEVHGELENMHDKLNEKLSVNLGEFAHDLKTLRDDNEHLRCDLIRFKQETHLNISDLKSKIDAEERRHLGTFKLIDKDLNDLMANHKTTSDILHTLSKKYDGLNGNYIRRSNQFNRSIQKLNREVSNLEEELSVTDSSIDDIRNDISEIEEQLADIDVNNDSETITGDLQNMTNADFEHRLQQLENQLSLNTKIDERTKK